MLEGNKLQARLWKHKLTPQNENNKKAKSLKATSLSKLQHMWK
jgi:hypothetical protein